MRTSHIIVVTLAIIACCFCYWLGFRTGAKESPLKGDREGHLFMALRMYQAMERTNYAKVQSTLAGQVFALTRDYERKYGIPIGTNRFAQTFAEAKAVANSFQKQLVPLGAALTNLPLAPSFKIGVEKKN